MLYALLLGACAGTTADRPKSDAADAAKTENVAALPSADADAATIAKQLPGTLEGEIRRAQLLRTKGDLDDAGRALAQLTLVAPDDARVVGEYGKVLTQQGHSQAAIPFLQRATELAPADWTLYSALGVAYDQADDHKQARAAYEHALQLSPAQPIVLNNVAVSHMLTGDLAGAQRLFAQARATANTPKIGNNIGMLADMRASAAHTSPPAAQSAHKAPSNPPDRIATAAPRPVGPAVVMQTVPADPLAGPVKAKVHARTRLAGQVKPKTVVHAAPPPPPPALRTAAEAN